MLFFRSEEAIDLWCARRGLQRGPSATLGQLWQLAMAWYAGRLSPEAERPRPDEIRRILDRCALSDPAWNPLADDF